MQLKKMLCIGLSLAMIVSSAGCGNTATGAATAADAEGTEETADASADAAGGEENDAAADAAAAEDGAAAEADAAGEEENGADADAAADAAAEADGAAADAAADDAAATEKAADTAVSSAASEEIPAEDISVTWEDSRVYPHMTMGRYNTITTYGVKGYEDVPFIAVDDYLNVLLEDKEKISMENGKMTVLSYGSAAVIDPAADTITFEDPAKFRYSGLIEGSTLTEPEYNVVTPSTKNKSTETPSNPLTISMADYHMPVIAYEDTVIMPFLALQNSFGSVCMNNMLAYNGKDYYNAFEAKDFLMKSTAADFESPYMKALKSGPFSQKSETTKAYAEYAYYSDCLLLDLSFGHKEEKNITTFDEYFTRMNAKASMCSTNPSTAVTAELLLFNYLFDSGHDAMLDYETVFGQVAAPDSSQAGEIADEIKESEEGSQLFEEGQEAMPTDEDLTMDAIIGMLIEKGLKIPEVLPLYAWTAFFGSTRPQDYGNLRLDYVDDTAVIYFRSFTDTSSERKYSFYLDPIKDEELESSNFAFFYKCFEDIKQHDEVKNVVINLSDNGGGDVAGLLAILGFLSEDGEVKFTDQDLIAGNYREEYYHVDTNLDGIADDNDGYGGQYDFYIMCSGNSYSCANALPYFAQQQGLAKIIGTAPGGGDCVVGYFIDAYGRCAYYSGPLKLGTDGGSGFVSNEKATVPDLNMMPSIFDVSNVPWFDAEGITDAVHQYKDGKTVIEYTTDESGGDLSDYLEQLFEQMAG